MSLDTHRILFNVLKRNILNGKFRQSLLRDLFYEKRASFEMLLTRSSGPELQHLSEVQILNPILCWMPNLLTDKVNPIKKNSKLNYKILFVNKFG